MSDQDARPEDFGKHLREAREASGVSLRELSATTKISMTVLQALEANDVAQVPGGIFGRSFVRAYAEEVGLDPEATVAAFLETLPGKGNREPAKANASYEAVEGGGNAQVSTLAVRLAVISLVIIALIFFFVSRGGETPEGAESGNTPHGAEGTPTEPPPPSSSAASSLPSSQSLAESPALEGPLSIELHPTGETWVSFTVDGERVVSRVFQAGDREVYEAREGVLLNVGDAGAFAFSINQQLGRALGESGDTVTVEIDRTNYQDFVARP
jgi:cytoskeletal protein RodZ